MHERLSCACRWQSADRTSGDAPATDRRLRNRATVGYHRTPAYAARYPDTALMDSQMPKSTTRRLHRIEGALKAKVRVHRNQENDPWSKGLTLLSDNELEELDELLGLAMA